MKKGVQAFGSQYISYDHDQLLLQYRRNAGVGNLWIHCYGRKLEEKNERAAVKGFLCEGVRFLLPMIFAVLASGVLLVPTAIALIGRSSGESSGGSANAESLSVLLGSGNATKILKGLFFPQLRLSGVFIHRMVWDSER